MSGPTAAFDRAEGPSGIGFGPGRDLREYGFELEQVLDAGEEVVVLYRDRGRGKGSGAEIEHHWGLVITVDGGAITRSICYGDPAEALKPPVCRVADRGA